ncbi:hypothetical protein [Alkalimarinus alittae]|uniref:Uncharacterized protein n=1 Tax=Alkalimarinus alittae TaxID=2961619 RepID=A0ABY6MXP0_9ALTE|nr:hypothetical protein [Alkalimarinus alittae]UZE94599.1 hypothetical protein NKI27_10920 [Alkalimarinus alittae]
MDLSDKTPIRLVQVSLLFSLANFLINGLNTHNIVLFIVFTLTVFVSTKLYLLFTGLKQTTKSENLTELQTYLQLGSVLFIGVATLSYSYMFGIFYLFVFAIYLISPYDRDWLAGRSEIVFIENKLEYRRNQS